MSLREEAPLRLKPFVQGRKSDERVILRLRDEPQYLSVTWKEHKTLEELSSHAYTLGEFLSRHLEQQSHLTLPQAIDLLVRLHSRGWIDTAHPQDLEKLRDSLVETRAHASIKRGMTILQRMMDIPIRRFKGRAPAAWVTRLTKPLLSYAAIAVAALGALYGMWIAGPMIGYGEHQFDLWLDTPQVILTSVVRVVPACFAMLSLFQALLLWGSAIQFIPFSLRLAFLCVPRAVIDDEDAFMLNRNQVIRYRVMMLLLPWAFSGLSWYLFLTLADKPILALMSLCFSMMGVFSLSPLGRTQLVKLMEGKLAMPQFLPTARAYLVQRFSLGSIAKGSAEIAGGGFPPRMAQWVAGVALLSAAWILIIIVPFLQILAMAVEKLLQDIFPLKSASRGLPAFFLLSLMSRGAGLPLLRFLGMVMLVVLTALTRRLRMTRRHLAMTRRKPPSLSINEISNLQAVPLFSSLSPEALQGVFAKVQVRTYPTDSVLIQQGKPGDEFFVLAEGEAKIEVKAENGIRAVVETLTPGDSFGEIALVEKVQRTASVIATKPVKALVIGREEFDLLFPEGGLERKHLTDSIRRIKIVSESPVLSHLDTHQVRRLLQSCESVDYPVGEAIVREGQMGEEAYLIEEGQVRVERSGLPNPVAMIGRGKMIGATALLKRMPRSASAVAHTPVSCLKISRKVFTQVCMSNIIVAMLLSEMSDSELGALEAKKKKRVMAG